MKAVLFLAFSTVFINPSLGNIGINPSNKIILPEIISPYSYANDFDEIIATPYKAGNLCSVKFKLSFKKETSSGPYIAIRQYEKDLTAVLTLSCNDGYKVSEEVYSTHIPGDDYELSDSFTYLVGSSFDSGSIYFSVKVHGSSIITKTVKLKGVSDLSYQAVYNSNNCKRTAKEMVYYYTHDDGVTYLDEVFDFSHFLSYSVNRFNYFDISSLYFNRSCLPNTFEITKLNKAWLQLPNSEQRFIDIGEGNAKSRNIPLKIMYSLLGSKNYFKPDVNMYINPDTHEMSGLEKDGYVLTDKFFFTRTGLQSIGASSFYVYIENAGYSLSSFRIAFKVSQDETSFNAYGNVAYSVAVESVATNFNVGEVIDH